MRPCATRSRPRPRPPCRQALHQVGRCRRRRRLRARSIIMRRAAVAASAHRQQAVRPTDRQTDRTAGEPYTSHITHRRTRTDGADRNFRDAEGFEKRLDGFRMAIPTQSAALFRLGKFHKTEEACNLFLISFCLSCRRLSKALIKPLSRLS